MKSFICSTIIASCSLIAVESDADTNLLQEVEPTATTFVDGVDYSAMHRSGIGAASADLILVDGAISDDPGCDAIDFPAASAGRIVLIPRRDTARYCTFRRKVVNADAAGAVGAIIFNAPSEPELLRGTVEDFDNPSDVAIPVVGTTFALGDRWRSLLLDGSNVHVVLLVDDSDSDGLTEEEEAALGTNPDDPDSDRDSLGDGDEVNVHGTDPNDDDTDGDGFSDGEEVANGTDPTDPGDSLAFVVQVVEDAPDSAFKAKGHRNAILARLDDVRAALAAGDIAGAIGELRNLRRKVDGCGKLLGLELPDSNDWIDDCAVQRELRDAIDQAIANLEN